MPSKSSHKPSYPALKLKMRARSRAFNRLACLHRPDFLRLFGEELAFLEAEAAREAAAPPPLPPGLEDYQFIGGDNMTAKEAADRLRVTPRTVVRYRERLREAS